MASASPILVRETNIKRKILTYVGSEKTLAEKTRNKKSGFSHYFEAKLSEKAA